LPHGIAWPFGNMPSPAINVVAQPTGHALIGGAAQLAITQHLGG
jgi:hypothetical protein